MYSKWVPYAKASGDTVLAVAVALAVIAGLRVYPCYMARASGERSIALDMTTRLRTNHLVRRNR